MSQMRGSCYLISFLLPLLFVVNFCNADHNTIEVVGAGECADCDNFKTSQVFSGLRVSIDCKLGNGHTERIGSGRLDELGNFKIKLSNEAVAENGKQLKEECYAQLHDSTASPCPAHDGLEAAKIVFQSRGENKFTFVPTKKVRFSSALCGSKFAWPYYFKHHYSHWKKKKKFFPPIKNFLHPFPPLNKPKPIPQPSPVYKPPVVKPLPPHVPIYKPKPKSPVVKPFPPHDVPSYKPKPKPEPKPPVYKPKPKPSVYKPKPKPPVVIDKPPIPTPVFPIPFPKKKPCPPFPKIFHKKKHFFQHPKFGYFPPLPPFVNVPQP